MEVDYSDLEFDEEKYYLGSLCKRGHDWKSTGRSLRHNRDRACIECMKFLQSRWRKKHRPSMNEKRRNWYARLSAIRRREFLDAQAQSIKDWKKTPKGIKYGEKYRRSDSRREVLSRYHQKRDHWKGVIELINREEASDLLVVLTMEQMDYLINFGMELRRLHKEKNWKEYFMRVRNMIEVHGEHLGALLSGEARQPQFLLKSINRATNTHLAVLREERQTVVTNAFNHPDQTPELIALSS